MKPVEQPDYSRSDITVGIVHFGVGNFHRSHQAMYLDRLFNRGEDRDWGICGVGVMPSDARMRDVLAAQDLRYTLVERRPDGETPARTIGSIVEYLYAPDDPEAVFERLADPSIRIVSLTITEGGYNVSDVTGEFDDFNPAIVADLVPGAVPATVFGIVVEGLRRRRDRGIPPFTVMSCDNLEGNGHVAERSFIRFAELADTELGDWMRAEVCFPNSMVDRITPVTTDADREFVRETFGVDDAWPVICEDFVQWVLEDKFTLGRPSYEHVGVQVVDDVTPYERMKLRLLNASHQAMAYFGYLMGYRYAHEASSDPLIARLLERYMKDEAEPTLAPAPGIDFGEYEHSLMERFGNPYVRDTLIRLATDASDRLAKFLFPVVIDRRAKGLSSPLSASIIASWVRFATGVDEQGNVIPLIERRKAVIDEALAGNDTDPIGFLIATDFFGDIAADDPLLAEEIATVYREITAQGARVTLESLVDAPTHHN